METFRTLIDGHLSPAGEPVAWPGKGHAQELPTFPDYIGTWVDSGTAALALAFTALHKRRPDVSQPEVIIPAYCCPDLVAAAVHAGVKPVAVDIQVDDPSYDLEALREAISENTLAVVAVNFLGIAERTDRLTELLAGFPGVTLVEDNAQWFPETPHEGRLRGEFVVFSFGRGKPVSLLGGGLLLHKAAVDVNLPPTQTAGLRSRMSTSLKFFAYNQLLRPQLYQLLTRAPFIRLGETRYKPLDAIAPIDSYRARLLLDNIRSYQSREPTAAKRLDSLLHERNLFGALHSERRQRLLRYPLLTPEAQLRDRLLARLTQAGLGATAMYQQTLSKIPGLENRVHFKHSCTNAHEFAQRLLTLPVHSGVKAHHQDRISEIIRETWA